MQYSSEIVFLGVIHFRVVHFGSPLGQSIKGSPWTGGQCFVHHPLLCRSSFSPLGVFPCMVYIGAYSLLGFGLSAVINRVSILVILVINRAQFLHSMLFRRSYSFIIIDKVIKSLHKCQLQQQDIKFLSGHEQGRENLRFWFKKE